MEWLPPGAIIFFGSLFWQVNNWLHTWERVSFRQTNDLTDGKNVKGKDIKGEMPRDHLMGVATLIALSPLVVVPLMRIGNALEAVIYSGYPVLAMIVLGQWRGRKSVSGMLFFGAHGFEMSLLSFLNKLSHVESFETAKFWMHMWITVSIAFVVVFAGALGGMYRIDRERYGWSAMPEETQILACLYSISAIWMLTAGFLWWGLPAIQLVMKLPPII